MEFIKIEIPSQVSGWVLSWLRHLPKALGRTFVFGGLALIRFGGQVNYAV
jgi:hypothetical protein